MANNSNPAQGIEIRDLRSRIEWLDGERRKLAKKVGELEQALELSVQDIEGREQRLQDLEKRLSTASAQLGRVSQLDTLLSQFKDEVVSMIEQYDQRRIRGGNEFDRLRRVEHEGLAREIADVRKELPAISRLQNAMELRIAEESRLAGLIGELQNRLSALEKSMENKDGAISYLEEKEKLNSRSISESKTAILESSKRWDHFRDQLEILRAGAMKLESAQQALSEEQTKQRESMKGWQEQIQLGEYERNQRIENWQREFGQREDVMTGYSKEWVAFSDQYKEAKMAVQTLSEWQKQLEQQQREASELLRLEAHRLQARWDDYQLENANAWKTFTIEVEQRWMAFSRYEKQVQERLEAFNEWITRLEQEKEMLQRVQSAQTDAIKRIPLLWIEEVDKAIAQNPSRRRQPALIPVRED
jgi:chromosome segregation ATPase